MVKGSDSPRLPREENEVSTASFSLAPTATTHGACAYGLWVSSRGPSLPAAHTLTMPLLYSSSLAMLSALSGSNLPDMPQELRVPLLGLSLLTGVVAAFL